MALTAHDDVATALGVETPAPDSLTAKRWDMWIGVAERDIDRHFSRIGGIRALDADDVRYVVAEAVASKDRDPVGTKQESVSVDDGSLSKTFTRTTGDVTILPEWWQRLRPADEGPRGGPVRTTYVQYTGGRLKWR